MKKIPSLFLRDFDRNPNLVLPVYTPDTEWVVAGYGYGWATQKFDGAAVRVDKEGNLWARYDAKHGKTPPPSFEPCQEADPKTGHWPGWVKVGDNDSQYVWHMLAFHRTRYGGRSGRNLPEGTYEICGPHFQGNPERAEIDHLVMHGLVHLENVPVEFESLKSWFRGKDIEGVVWHSADGHMVKIKKKDFGLRRQD